MFIKVSLLYIELYNKNLKYNKYHIIVQNHSVRVMSMRQNMYKHKIQVKDPMTKRLKLSSVYEAPSKYLNKS